MGNKNNNLRLSYVNGDIGHIGPGQKPSIASHCPPVTRVKARLTRSPGVCRRDFTKEASRADDLDFDALDWFIIEVKTGKEDVARMVCRAKGFGTCLPMLRTKVGRSYYAKAASTRVYPVLTGYLFIGMSRDTPGWPELMSPSFMLAVVGISDRAYRLDKCVIDRFLGRYESDYYKRSAAAEMDHLCDFRVGDYVRVLAGPLERHVVPVVRMRQEQAVVVARVLGKDCEISMRLDDLRKSA